VTMISRGVEISMTGGGGVMVRGLYFWPLFFLLFFFFFVILRYLFLGTKSLMQC